MEWVVEYVKMHCAGDFRLFCLIRVNKSLRRAFQKELKDLTTTWCYGLNWFNRFITNPHVIHAKDGNMDISWIMTEERVIVAEVEKSMDFKTPWKAVLLKILTDGSCRTMTIRLEFRPNENLFVIISDTTKVPPVVVDLLDFSKKFVKPLGITASFSVSPTMKCFGRSNSPSYMSMSDWQEIGRFETMVTSGEFGTPINLLGGHPLPE
jgi:hypothetical protein